MSMAAHGAPLLPWGGFFQKLSSADVFVILDDTKMPHGRTWLNRCMINVAGRPQLLTVPIQRSGKSDVLRKDVQIDVSSKWRRSNTETIRHAYKKTPFWTEVADLIIPEFEREYRFLFDMNIALISGIADYLKIRASIVRQSELPEVSTNPSERLLQLSMDLGGHHYISGTGASDYLDRKLFADNGVSISWISHHETAYRQFHSDQFIGGLSVIDRLFNQGAGSGFEKCAVLKNALEDIV